MWTRKGRARAALAALSLRAGIRSARRCVLYVDHFLSGIASMASPGVDEVRWPNPVRPGDSIRIRVTILETTPSRSKSDRGVVRSRLEAFNQSDEPILSFLAINILKRRPQ